MFLDSIRERQEEEERQRKEKDGEEVKNFKEAVAARTSAINQTMSAAPVAPKPSTIKDPKRTLRLKGVVVKKRTVKPVEKRTNPALSPSVPDTKSKPAKPEQSDDNAPPDPKRRKVV